MVERYDEGYDWSYVVRSAHARNPGANLDRRGEVWRYRCPLTFEAVLGIFPSLRLVGKMFVEEFATWVLLAQMSRGVRTPSTSYLEKARSLEKPMSGKMTGTNSRWSAQADRVRVRDVVRGHRYSVVGRYVSGYVERYVYAKDRKKRMGADADTPHRINA